MSKIQIDIDDALLARAAEVLGTTTKRATVEAALRATTAAHARRRLGELMAETPSTQADLDREADNAWH